MQRKDFIKGTCTVCVAFGSGLFGALLDACKTPLSVVKTTAKGGLVIIPLTEFEKGDFKLVRVANYDYDLAVQKKTDGTFDVLVLKCTHAGQPLTRTGNNYYCTLHGSQFDHSGHVTKGPAETGLLSLNNHADKNSIFIQLK